ncbi:hypothetical protein BpHYR1_046878 [Brachionus plicatilis]|uniref:Uncharacterized protein n=1 Tax=Brachionus plicatilis TaxID=10195 RepID=A0A3M7RIL5_BRAPC|nr:hypothetical protein BpHYR1_046878 [Brachionus plicatilis]
MSELNPEQLSSLISISPFQSQKTWILIFKNSPKFLFDRELTIDGIITMEKDASIPDKLPTNNPTLVVTMAANLRFHCLSPNFDHSKIKKFLENNLKISKKFTIQSISNEKFNFENFTQVTNGVIKVTIESYDLIDHEDFIYIVGTHNIESQRCLVQLAGYYKRCNFCKKFGHIHSGCESFRILCKKC